MRQKQGISPERDRNVKTGQAYCFSYTKQRETTAEMQIALAHQMQLEVKAACKE